jgi:hypothetical protein
METWRAGQSMPGEGIPGYEAERDKRMRDRERRGWSSRQPQPGLHGKGAFSNSMSFTQSEPLPP